MSAALYLVFAALLLGMADRWIAPITWKAALVLALMPLAYTGRALLSGRVYAPIDLPYAAEPLKAYAAEYGIHEIRSPMLSDVYCQIMPWKHAVREAIAQGEWPLWNRHMLCGDILAASGTPAAYDPINVLGYVIPLPHALTYEATAVFLFAALSMFLLLRELGCRDEPALFGAAAWTFCGYMSFKVLWSLGHAAAIFPLVILGARRVVREPGMRSIALLTASLAYMMLAGHPETALHVVAVGALWGLAELGTVRFRRLPLVLGGALAAGVFALALSAIYLFPLLEALPQTREHAFREAFFVHQDRGVPVDESLRRLAPQFLPFLAGSLDDPPTFPFAYAGTLLFPFAVYGLWRSPWKGRWPLFVLGTLGLLLGVHLDGLSDALAKLPLFDIALNERLIFVWVFALATVAALGADEWIRRSDRLLPVLVVAELAALAVFVALWRPPANFPADGWSLFASGVPLAFAPLALAAIALVVPLRPERRLVLCLALLLAQRAGEMGGYYPTLPATAFYPRVPPLDAIPSTPPLSRFVATGFNLLPNGPTMYGLEEARGYQGMTNQRTFDLQPIWSQQQGVWFNRADSLEAPFLDLVGVRWALAQQGPAPDGWRRIATARTTALFENENPLPRVFLPEEVCINFPQEVVLGQMRRERNFGAHAWVNGAQLGTSRVVKNGRARLSARRRGSSEYLMRASVGRAAWVLVTETAWRGWRLWIDGREESLYFGDHAFLAFHLPRGDHHVRLLYRPRSFELGAAVSAAAVLLLMGIAALRFGRADAPVSSRREPDTPTPRAVVRERSAALEEAVDLS